MTSERDNDQIETFDQIVRDLQDLRARAGAISYSEIGARIAALRESRGMSASAAQPARSTVYDAFRLGRARVNAALVGDIARVLGATEAEAASWEARCGRARPGTTTPRATSPEPEAPADDAVPPPTSPPALRGRDISPVRIAALIAGCIGLNLLGHAAVAWLGLPLFLDMIGTAVAAIALGPWRGVLVAVVSQVAAIPLAAGEQQPLAFALVNIAGALVWGYGVHRFGFGRTLPRFLSLNVMVGVACTLVAVPIIFAVFEGGHGGHSADGMTDRFADVSGSLILAVTASNLFTSVADKVLTGVIALVVIMLLRWRVTAPLPLGAPHAER